MGDSFCSGFVAWLPSGRMEGPESTAARIVLAMDKCPPGGVTLSREL